MDYYDKQAQDFFDSTVSVDMSDLYSAFLPLLPSNGLILDAGCGSGRDSKAFREIGFEVEAIDASAKLCALASSYAGIEVQQKQFHEIDKFDYYDGVWACASLLHEKDINIPLALDTLLKSLRSDGIMYCSFKHGDGVRLKGNRFFNDMSQTKFERLISSSNLCNIRSTWITDDRRADRNEQWFNAILQRM